MNDRRVQIVALALALSLCALLFSLVVAIRPPQPGSTSSPTATATATATQSLTATPTIIPYRTVVMLRHDAMESVFYWFPERRDLRADAFIAMYDCANIGRWFWLRLPDGFQYRVVVTDCMQEKHQAAHRAKWGDVEVIELDGVFWRARGLTLRGGVMGEIAEAGP